MFNKILPTRLLNFKYRSPLFSYLYLCTLNRYESKDLANFDRALRSCIVYYIYGRGGGFGFHYYSENAKKARWVLVVEFNSLTLKMEIHLFLITQRVLNLFWLIVLSRLFTGSIMEIS